MNIDAPYMHTALRIERINPCKSWREESVSWTSLSMESRGNKEHQPAVRGASSYFASSTALADVEIDLTCQKDRKFSSRQLETLAKVLEQMQVDLQLENMMHIFIQLKDPIKSGLIKMPIELKICFI